MGGGGGPQTVNQRSDPWSGVIPYLQGAPGTQATSQTIPGTQGRWEYPTGDPMSGVWVDGKPEQTINTPGTSAGVGILPEAARLYGQSGSIFADPSTQTNDALSMMEARARGGSDLTRAAQNENLATVRGDYLFGNPGFNAAFDAASRRILPQVDSTFASGGRYGGGLAKTAQTQALGDAFAGLYGQERGRQQAAVGMAPNLANLDYLDLAQLAQVGAQHDASAQQSLDEPFTRLNRYQSFINPVLGVGGSSTQSQPTYQNKGAGLLGGAALSMAMGNPLPLLMGLL